MGRADAVYWGSKYNVDLFFSALARRAPRVVTQPLSQPAPLRHGPFFNRPIFLPPTLSAPRFNRPFAEAALVKQAL